MKKALSLSILVLGTAMSMTSHAAGTATGNLDVKVTITSSCAINTSSTGGSIGDSVIDFGTQSSFATAVNANTATTAGTAGAVNVLCNNGTKWTLAFDGGKYASSGQRNMAGGSSEYIPYNLYSDSSYSSAIAINGTVAGTGTGSVQAITVYGQIPAGTTLPSVSSYSDVVTMTITY